MSEQPKDMTPAIKPANGVDVLSVLRIAVPRMATVASIWGVPEDTDAFLKLLRLQEKLTKESKLSP